MEVSNFFTSPERLQNKMVQERLKKCISILLLLMRRTVFQNGVTILDRLIKIAEIRSFIDAPLLALTATATPDVVEDIQKQLLSRNQM